jgi:hypothetical protein
MNFWKNKMTCEMEGVNEGDMHESTSREIGHKQSNTDIAVAVYSQQHEPGGEDKHRNWSMKEGIHKSPARH